jgi:hypothetical protein
MFANEFFQNYRDSIEKAICALLLLSYLFSGVAWKIGGSRSLRTQGHRVNTIKQTGGDGSFGE